MANLLYLIFQKQLNNISKITHRLNIHILFSLAKIADEDSNKLFLKIIYSRLYMEIVLYLHTYAWRQSYVHARMPFLVKNNMSLNFK